jgi:hypothetical protein
VERRKASELSKVAFEPDVNVPGGCDKDVENVLNGSALRWMFSSFPC